MKKMRDNIKRNKILGTNLTEDIYIFLQPKQVNMIEDTEEATNKRGDLMLLQKLEEIVGGGYVQN